MLSICLAWGYPTVKGGSVEEKEIAEVAGSGGQQ